MLNDDKTPNVWAGGDAKPSLCTKSRIAAASIAACEAKLTQGAEPVAVAIGANWITEPLYSASAIAAAKLAGQREMREAAAKKAEVALLGLAKALSSRVVHAIRNLPLGGGE